MRFKPYGLTLRGKSAFRQSENALQKNLARALVHAPAGGRRPAERLSRSRDAASSRITRAGEGMGGLVGSGLIIKISFLRANTQKNTYITLNNVHLYLSVHYARVLGKMGEFEGEETPFCRKQKGFLPPQENRNDS